MLLDWFSGTARLLFLLPFMAPRHGRVREAMRGRWWLAAAVGVLSPLGYILVLMALRMGAPLSFVAPAREMSMMLGALLGLLVLREQVGIWRLGGCVALAAGVLALGSSTG